MACVLIVFLAPHLFSSLFITIAAPFWRTEFSVASGSLKSPERLLVENQLLMSRVESMQALIDTVGYIEQENRELRALLNRPVLSSGIVATTSTTTSSTTDSVASVSSERIDQPGTLAAVLKRPPALPYDEIVVDIGTDHGVSTSSRAYAPGAILIGRVISVRDTTSTVRLYSSPGERHEVLVGPSHAPGVAIGRGGGEYEVQVSKDINISEGDYITNPSLGEGPFGVVNLVLSETAQPFTTVIFSPPVNIYHLRWVTIR